MAVRHVEPPRPAFSQRRRLRVLPDRGDGSKHAVPARRREAVVAVEAARRVLSARCAGTTLDCGMPGRPPTPWRRPLPGLAQGCRGDRGEPHQSRRARERIASSPVPRHVGAKYRIARCRRILVVGSAGTADLPICRRLRQRGLPEPKARHRRAGARRGMPARRRRKTLARTACSGLRGGPRGGPFAAPVLMRRGALAVGRCPWTACRREPATFRRWRRAAHCQPSPGATRAAPSGDHATGETELAKSTSP